ncbi:MAG TPA: DoxX family protein [Nitrospiraceae bacterium]|nr:DoxX family protein [Nitrospiraceae bacterium]
MAIYDHPYSTLIGRLLLGAIFLLSGINKIADPAGTQGYMVTMGMTWATMLFYLGAIVIEVGGGLSLWLGYWTRIGAAVLIGFMIPTTLIFHTGFADPNQMIHFMKNLAVTGGLLYLATYGPGPLSLDRRMSERAGIEADLESLRVRRRASA